MMIFELKIKTDMHHPKRVLLFILSMLLFLSHARSQGIERVIVEKYYISDENDQKAAKNGHLPPGSVTYRIFLDLKYRYKLQAVFGVPGHRMRIATTTKFYNCDEVGGVYANDATAIDLSIGTAMLDSWVSVGAAGSAYFGVPKEKDDTTKTIVNREKPKVLQNKDPRAGIPISVRDGLKAASPQLAVTPFGIEKELENCFGKGANKTNGPELSTENGSWASFGGAIGPDTNNVILIAQLTTDGELSFELNVQLATPTGDIEQYVAKNPTGKEIITTSLNYPAPKDNQLPVVKITSPKNGETAKPGDLLTLKATAKDDGSVINVEFYVNDVKVADDAGKPYEFNWAVRGVGKTKISAIAVDNLGARSKEDAVFINLPAK